MRTRKFAFEIIWPLIKQDKFILSQIIYNRSVSNAPERGQIRAPQWPPKWLQQIFIFSLFNLKKLTYQSIWGICYLNKNHSWRRHWLCWRFFFLFKNSNHVLHWNKNENIINCLNTDWLVSYGLLSFYLGWGGTVCWIGVKVAVLCARQYMSWNMFLIKVLNNFWYFEHQILTMICSEAYLKHNWRNYSWKM